MWQHCRIQGAGGKYQVESRVAGRSELCPRESLLEVLWGLDVRIPFWMPESMSEPRFGCRNPNGNKMRRNTETQLRKSLRRNLRNKTQGRRIPRNGTKKDIRKERSEDPICLVSRASLHSSDCLSRHETTQGAKGAGRIPSTRKKFPHPPSLFVYLY